MLVNQKVTFETVCGCGAKHHSVIDLPVEIPESLTISGQVENFDFTDIKKDKEKREAVSEPAQNYVVGIVTDGTDMDSQIVMVEKQHPAWQVGRLNGPGGIVDCLPDERPPSEVVRHAMVRTFEKETGLAIYPHIWIEVVRLIAGPEQGDYQVSFFRAVLPSLQFAKIDRQDDQEPLCFTTIKEIVTGSTLINCVDFFAAAVALSLETNLEFPVIIRRK